MGLAEGGQILLTRAAFDSARQHILLVEEGAPVEWRAHGPYRFAGVEDPLEVFEVGVTGLSPLRPPAGSEKARRVVAPDDEATLGWRPAVGHGVPGREEWKLEKKLGEGGFGEVWLARNSRTKEPRTFKFCFKAERLRTLKRELTLFRLMKEVLGERRDIARLYDVQLESAPFFLEMSYTEGGDLVQWAERRGGIDKLPLELRLGIVAQVAEALAAAHSVGVIHKDVKPTNVLIDERKDGSIQAILTDFGIGQLTQREVLEMAGVTGEGFSTRGSTVLTELGSRSGTRLYMAPELMAGEPPSIQSDLYSLGVTLYQVAAGDLTRPLGQGWERDVEDELLREDIAACVDGLPERRLRGAGELGARLRELNARRERREAERLARAAAARAEYETARARRRQKVLRAWLAVSLLLVAAATTLAVVFNNLRIEAIAARTEAEHRKAELERVADFQASMLSGIDPETMGRRLIEDLMTEVEAAMARRGDAATEIQTALRGLDELLRGANATNLAVNSIDRNILERSLSAIERDLADQPLVKARLLQTIAGIYRSLGLLEAARPPQEEGLQIRRLYLGDEHHDTLVSIGNLGLLSQEEGRLIEAERFTREALEGRRKTLGSLHPETLSSMGNLGVVLREQGKLAEAERYFRQTLEGYRRALGERHARSFLSIYNVGWVLILQRKFEEAEAFMRGPLERSRRILGVEHETTLYLINGMGVALRNQGKLVEAETYLREALDIRRRVLGDRHPRTLASIANMGRHSRLQGKLDEAEQYFRESLEGYRHALGDDHRYTLLSIESMGLVLREQGKLDGAEAHWREALSGFRRVLGEDHANVATVFRNLTTLSSNYEEQARFDDAQRLRRDLVGIMRQMTESAHSDLASSAAELGDAFFQRGDARTALEAYQFHASIWRARTESNSENVTARNNWAWGHVLIGRAHAKAGDEAAAREAWTRAVELFEPLVGKTETPNQLDTYAQALLNLGRVEEARPIVEKLLAAGWSEAEFIALCRKHGLIDP
jgi:tetratricopeptide (TPR) repeat protein